MPKDYSQAVADIAEMARELEVAQRHIKDLEAQILELKADPVKARPAWNPRLLDHVDTLCPMSTRSQTCLQNRGIEFIYQLVVRTEAEMLSIKNFGRKSLNEIKELLADLGLSLGMKLPDDFPRKNPEPE